MLERLMNLTIINRDIPTEVNTMGAVVSVYSSGDKVAIEKRWHCQLQTHEVYCKKHGYACLLVLDNTDWRSSRSGHVGHWMKLQAILDLLPKYPSLYMPGGKGWSTEMMFFRNTEWSMRFLEHFWNLRHFCPDCNAEQCAGHVAMFDAMLTHAYKEVQQGIRPDMIRIKRDHHLREQSHMNCCNPKDHCEYPHGKSNKRNHNHNKSPQGCIWNWQAALGFCPENDSDGSIPPLRNDHEHIAWEFPIRQLLNTSHPVKSMTC
eukprot:gene11725-24593_t